MAKTKALMNQVEYGHHIGKTKPYVNRLVREGVLIMQGARIDVKASDAVLNDKPMEPLVDDESKVSFAGARTTEMIYRAKMKKVEYEIRVGKLVDAKEVAAAWSDIYRKIVDAVMAWPNRVTPEVASLTDERKVRAVLDKEARHLIDSLREKIQRAHK